MSSSVPPLVSHESRAPRKASPLAKTIVAIALVGLCIPVGAKIKAATAKQKAMEEDRTKTAESAAAKDKGPISAKAIHPEAASWTPSVAFDGTLQPIADAMLAFKATGPLSTLKVKTGDYVKKGDLLGALDATEAYAQSKAAAAQISAAKASLALAKDNAERTEAMVKGGSAPAMQKTQADGQLDLTTAQLDGAQAQLALAGANIKNHTLTAPFAGFVTMAPNTIGGLVAAGTPIFRLQDTSKLRLVGTVGELDVSLVKVGAVVSVHVNSTNKDVPAKVTAVLPSVDPATRRIPVEAELVNDEKDPILAGTFVRATIAGGAPIDVLKLPASAIRPGAQDEVLVVEKGKLRVAKIVFTRTSDGSLFVRSGVSANDQVLSNPTPEAKDGDAVSIE